MERERQTFKILMFPWLAHGHIFPFLELSKNLSKTSHFTIYLCCTAVNLDSIRASLVRDSVPVELVELHMPSDSSSSFSEIVDSVGPDLVIYDFFQPWAPKLASRKGIPSVYFLTSAAATFSYYHHFYTKGTGVTFPYKAISLPDSEVIKVWNLITPHIKDADDDFSFGNFTRSSDIVLVKSCSEIEVKYIDYLSSLCKKRMVCTGPLIVDSFDCNEEERLKIMRWLDGKKHGSTLYISFGSECFLSRDQIGEIAKGLLLCEVNFLWVLRFPLEAKITAMEEMLPQGFIETVKGRGLTVSTWSPHTKILGHGSIGGFLSHCGWSSVLEAMYFGVPVIALPMKADQPLNAQLVAESGIGVGVEREDSGVYMRQEIAKAINKVMVEEASYEGLRSKARRLSKAVKEKDEDEANEVAEQLLKICVKNKK